jgi:hypothetical protein
MIDPFNRIFSEAPGMETYIRDLLGIDLILFDQTIQPLLTFLIIIIWTILFLGLSILRLNTYKRK